MKTIVLVTISNVFMNLSLVWTLKVQTLAALAGDPGQLGRGIIRIHFSGAGQSRRLQ
jgi:hypothetical protein